MGHLAQSVYLSPSVTFISFQENVNTATGEWVEMMPFRNIRRTYRLPAKKEIKKTMEKALAQQSQKTA